MPIYEYQCVDCNGRDERVAGLDDDVALCSECGGLMLRLEGDLFTPYFAVPIMPAPEKCDQEDADRSGV